MIETDTSVFPVLEKQTRADLVHTQTIKIASIDGSPPQGLSEARRAGMIFDFLSTIRRGGAPSGAAALIVSVGQNGNNLRIIVKNTVFHRKL